MNGMRIVPFCLFLLLFSCKSDDDYIDMPEESPVVFDINQVPYPSLADYNFFEGALADLQPVYGVLPFEPISSLFTDYALKKRFVWMPDGVSATYTTDYESLNFPVGAVLIKNFYYENTLPDNAIQIIETRLMIRKPAGWEFANYVWNENQTAATLSLAGGPVPVSWSHNGTPREFVYRIPNKEECFMCHKQGDQAVPIGPKPQNLDKIFAFADGSQNQLTKWKEVGYLGDYPSGIDKVVDYADASQNLEQRVRSYFDINCAHCHTDLGHCDYRALRMSYAETTDPLNLGLCVEPDTDIGFWFPEYNPSHIVYPGDHEKSVVYFRMNSEFENLQMPLVGKRLIHEEAVDLVVAWINGLEGSCD